MAGTIGDSDRIFFRAFVLASSDFELQLIFFFFNFFISSALFIPAFFFSGIIWPIESMHRLAQHLSHALPLTLPINSLRYILSRGPDMRYSQIVLGFSISTGYIVGLLLLTVAIFKCKTSS